MVAAFASGGVGIKKSQVYQEIPATPSGEPGWWLTSGQIKELLGCSSHNMIDRMVEDGDLPQPEVMLGRNRLWDRDAVARYTQGGWKVNIEDLGFPKIVFDPKKDSLMTIEEVIELMGFSSRPAFQVKLDEPGAFPPPYWRPGRPLPTYWLRSRVLSWLNAEHAIKIFHRPEPGIYELEYDEQRLGRILKRDEGTRWVRARKSSAGHKKGQLYESKVIRWYIDGEDQPYKKRKDAAIALIRRHLNEKSVSQ